MSMHAASRPGQGRGHAWLQVSLWLIVLLVAGPSLAAPERIQVALTGPMVERYIKSRPEFEVLFKGFETRFGPLAQEEGEDEILALARYLDRPAARTAVNAVLKRYGFVSFEQWSNISYSVLLAAGTALSPATGATLEEEKAKVAEHIRAEPALSPKERQDQLRDLDDQFAALAQYAPKAGNIEAVRPYLDQLKTLISAD
jgi:tellurite resistance protein